MEFWRYAMKILFILLLSISNLSKFQTPVTDQKFEALTIEVCKIELTDIGRLSSFRANLIYSISTDKDGFVSEIRALKNDNAQTLIKIKELETCLKNWILNPNDWYTIEISIGTIGGANYILIKDQRKRSIKLILK